MTDYHSLLIERIAEAIDTYRTGEISPDIALAAIGVLIDADRLEPPMRYTMTDEEQSQYQTILSRMSGIHFSKTRSTKDTQEFFEHWDAYHGRIRSWKYPQFWK